MIGLNTSVLVRYYIESAQAKQHRLAARPVMVSKSPVLEIEWVTCKFARRSKKLGMTPPVVVLSS
jgi:hypothetical protein